MIVVNAEKKGLLGLQRVYIYSGNACALWANICGRYQNIGTRIICNQ